MGNNVVEIINSKAVGYIVFTACVIVGVSFFFSQMREHGLVDKKTPATK